MNEIVCYHEELEDSKTFEVHYAKQTPHVGVLHWV